MITIKKLLPVLLAGMFSAGAIAQAVNTEPGEAMGPTGTGTMSSGASQSAGTPLKGEEGSQANTSPVTIQPGDAMGPTETSATDAGMTRSIGQGARTYRQDNSKPDAAVTINPGESMGPAGTAATSAGPKE